MKLKRQVSYRPELVDEGIELSVRHLKQYFSFGHGRNAFKTKAVHDVSFDIKKGECFGLVGESGCGKTTTGRSLIKLYHITSGSIYFEGYRISAGRRWNDKEIKWSRIKGRNKIKELRHEYDAKIAEEADAAKKKELAKQRDEEIKAIQVRVKEIKKEQKEAIAQIKYDNKHCDKKLMSKMQMIFQDPVDSLDPRMTVEDIIQEGLRIQGEHNRYANSKKVAEVLERVGLIPEYASRYPHEFSGGQRQRIGIARALIMKPQFLICDEPISALDVSIRAQIINLLNDLKEEMGLTIMFIAHDLSVVKYFCDRIGVMYFGQLVELATSDELFKHPLHPYTNALLSAIPKPDPISEKKRQRIVYKPQEVHDYSVEKPELTEIVPGHWVLANKPELEKYKETIAKLDKEAAKQKKNSKEADALSAKEEKARQAAEAKKAEEQKKAIEAALLAQEEARKAEEAKKVEKPQEAKPAEEDSKESKKEAKAKAKEEAKKAKLEAKEAKKAEKAALKEAKKDKPSKEEKAQKAAQEAKAEEEARKAEEEKARKEAEANRKQREKEAKERAELKARRQELLKEVRKPHRTGKEDIPAMFKGQSKKDEPSVTEKEMISQLRRYRPEDDQPALFKEREPDYYDTLPMFRDKQEPKVEIIVEPAPVVKPVEEEVNAPKLKSQKGLFVYETKEGKFAIKQTGEEKLVGEFHSEDEALKYAKALKRVNGVAVKVRGKDNRIYAL